jgi:hypothetical protein
MSKKERDRKEVQEFIYRFSKWDTQRLIQHLSIGLGNEFATQAINIILKQRGAK